MLLEKHLVIHRIGIIGINKTSALSFFKNWDKNQNLNGIRRFFSNRHTDLSEFSISIIETNKSILRKLYELFLYGDKTILFTCYIDNIIGDIVVKIK